MEKHVFETAEEMGAAAAAAAAESIKSAIENKGQANIIVGTGTSQYEMLANLTAAPTASLLRSKTVGAAKGIDFSKVTMFHLDEYIALGSGHPASFRKYLKERFVDKVGKLKAAYFVNGDAEDPQQECQRLGTVIAEHPIDVGLVGIGENGHLAFNDPPADFETEEPFIIVELDEKCRKQQLGEGWFESFEQVPSRAISMSIRQIMKSACLIVTVPDKRKAEAVRNALEGQVTPMCPASTLQEHKNCKIFIDKDAASLLSSPC